VHLTSRKYDLSLKLGLQLVVACIFAENTDGQVCSIFFIKFLTRYYTNVFTIEGALQIKFREGRLGAI
jgi:hypothetical protein